LEARKLYLTLPGARTGRTKVPASPVLGVRWQGRLGLSALNRLGKMEAISKEATVSKTCTFMLLRTGAHRES
jgi:hypothetical protein